MLIGTIEYQGRSRAALIQLEEAKARIIETGDCADVLDVVVKCGDLKRNQLELGETVEIADVRLRAPIPDPRRNIFCVGKNYSEHAAEFASSGFDASAEGAEVIPDYPVFFTKATTTVIGPGDPISDYSGLTQMLDYEVELAVIIGRGGASIRAQDAWAHVWGYTIVNDVTARDLQRNHKQWFLGKSLDGFCPMGPWAVTAGSVDVERLDIRAWVNGELRQSSNTSFLLFDIPRLIETLSRGMTLLPGDVIATGTPAGVGIGLNPPKFLKSGDVMTMEIAGIGRLSNAIVSSPTVQISDAGQAAGVLGGEVV